MQASVDVREEMLSNAVERKAAMSEMLGQAFKIMDENGNGMLTLPEFEEHVKAPEVQRYLLALELEHHEAKTIFEFLDYQKRGIISIDDFIAGCLKVTGALKNMDLQTVLFQNKKVINLIMHVIQIVEKGVLSIEERLRNQPLPASPMSMPYGGAAWSMCPPGDAVGYAAGMPWLGATSPTPAAITDAGPLADVIPPMPPTSMAAAPASQANSQQAPLPPEAATQAPVTATVLPAIALMDGPRPSPGLEGVVDGGETLAECPPASAKAKESLLWA
eukprot:NODE_9871_length_1393_cov_11.726698.p1 GENE.NODE_9871_length_1393_cov_11.726698~~NODE_9871_length_1393_cov_11.726698.p1  ORF type:complete len:275 (-),score=101.32 NODE_9871_length_1393_cov_11.726698:567-1391(-)